MISYFYHINDGKRDGGNFHHRWFWDTKRRKGYRLEVSVRRNLRLEFQRGEANDGGNGCSLSIGLGFLSIYFTFPVHDRWLIKRKCIATWDDNREFYLTEGRRYGFYFYEWAFVWSWHAKVNESSNSDPWWMHQYIHLDEKVLGKSEAVTDQLQDTRDVWFRLGDKEFKIDRIKWSRSKRFRTFIPFALWHRTRHHIEIKIDKPPMRSGKGENSWDCGDDGTFGMSRLWEGPLPRWDNLKEITPLAVQLYVDHVLKDAKRYGGSSGERGIKKDDAYEYIGHKTDKAAS